MKRRLLLILLLLCSAVYAQEAVFTAPKPSKAEMLRLGWDGYLDWAQTHLKGGGLNEAQIDSLAIEYAQVREAANRKLGIHATLQKAGRLAQQWKDLRLELTYNYVGGGTMYSHAMPRARADIADLVAHGHRDWKKSGVKVEPWSKAVKRFGPDNLKPEYPLNEFNPHSFRLSLAQEARLLQQLKAAVDALPPAPRARFRTFIRNMCELTREEG